MTAKPAKPRIPQPVFVEVETRLPEYDRRVLLSLELDRNSGSATYELKRTKSLVLVFGYLASTDAAGHSWSFETNAASSPNPQQLNVCYDVVAWRDVPECYCKPAELSSPVFMGDLED